LDFIYRFEMMYERAHSNQKKRDVEICVKNQDGTTFALVLNQFFVGFACIRHELTMKSPLELLRERIAMAGKDNSFIKF
jgi:hypothetical protein